MDRFDGDLPFFLEVLREFLVLSPARFRSIEEAVERGDGAQLRTITHNLRGSAGNLGADALSARVLAIENMDLGAANREAGRHLEQLRFELARIEAFVGEITGEAI